MTLEMARLIRKAREICEAINKPQFKKSFGGVIYVSKDGNIICYGTEGSAIVSNIDRLPLDATDEQIREFLETELAIWEMQG